MSNEMPLSVDTASEVSPQSSIIEQASIPPSANFMTPNRNKADSTVSSSSGPLLNRFTSWRKQAKDTAVAARGLFQTPSKQTSYPVQSATLSPAAANHTLDVPSPFFSSPPNETDEAVVEIVEEDGRPDFDAASSVLSGSVLSDDGSRSSRRGVTALQWAAASVVDSMQQSSYFRGRYNRGEAAASPSPAPEVPSSPASVTTPSSQTARILSSTQRSYMQSLMGRLQAPCEYVMLLGRGMLGVNLKQAYLKNQGVYVDFMLPGGSADKSAVIYVGDSLVSVGSVNVRKGNIWNVPQTIASSPRPVHLIFSTVGTSSNVAVERITHLDVCVGFLYHYGVLQNSDTSESLEHAAHKASKAIDPRTESIPEEDEEAESPDMELIAPTSFDDADAEESKNGTVTEETLELHALDTMDGFLSPASPPRHICEAILPHVAKRCNQNNYRDIESSILQLAANRVNFRAAARNAFLSCVVDPRRFPFLARHIAEPEDVNPSIRSSTGGIEVHEEATQQNNSMLMLFLDMMNYCALFNVSPALRRKEMADRIAYKYFLPSRVGKKELAPPAFDLHHIVSDMTLRSLEKELKDPELLTPETFIDFQRAIAETLSCEQSFLSFVVSSECARMRAYLRHAAPFVNVPLGYAVDQLTTKDSLDNPNSHNFFMYVLVYLLTLTDREPYGENDDIIDQTPGKEGGSEVYKRIEDAAVGLCTSFFIRQKILAPLRHDAQSPHLKENLAQFWDSFVAPKLGRLKFNDDDPFATFVKHLDGSMSLDPTEPFTYDPGFVSAAQCLSDELLYEYATNHHTMFQANKVHEWFCEEALKVEGVGTGKIPSLPGNCIKRLMRKVQWPPGVTPHKPSISSSAARQVDSVEMGSMGNVNAECAILFTASDDSANPEIQRHCCVSLCESQIGSLQPEEVVPTLETYAFLPGSRPKPFRQHHCSFAGQLGSELDISVVDFMIPRADVSSDEGDSALYGVCLAIHIGPGFMEMTQLDDGLSDEERYALEEALRALQAAHWTTHTSPQTKHRMIGLALVSQRNVLIAMRQSLTAFAHAFLNSRGPSLVNVLSRFCSSSMQADEILPKVLKPFLELVSMSWIDRPVNSQKDEYREMAGNQLLDSLPPIPLALLFIAALLEQKIVLSSSRRSVLLSVGTAITELLKPLKWCHLFVPRVPSTLAADLIQYPAPFIVGIASEDPGMLDLIRDLPDDVTLVDIDVGRVILASSLSNNGEMAKGKFESADEMIRALRLQVLFLAQSLGNVFGGHFQPNLWLCDRIVSPEGNVSGTTTRFQKLQTACHSFTEELVAGVCSCCYWIEESSEANVEPTILFDETRFFAFKRMRHQGFKPLFPQADEVVDKLKNLTLSMDDFNLVLELFVRCQSMNEYIGTRNKEEMALAF